jgi:hypothetical protein
MVNIPDFPAEAETHMVEEFQELPATMKTMLTSDQGKIS